jgi:hypothetical protein
MKKFISIIAACVGTLLSAAGIALPNAAADPNDAPDPNPAVADQPPGVQPDNPLFQSIVEGQEAGIPGLDVLGQP